MFFFSVFMYVILTCDSFQTVNLSTAVKEHKGANVLIHHSKGAAITLKCTFNLFRYPFDTQVRLQNAVSNISCIFKWNNWSCHQRYVCIKGNIQLNRWKSSNWSHMCRLLLYSMSFFSIKISLNWKKRYFFCFYFVV